MGGNCLLHHQAMVGSYAEMPTERRQMLFGAEGFSALDRCFGGP
jgi:hypothetical protein